MKLLLMLIVLASNYGLQAQYFSIKNVYNSDSTYVFPVFQSVARPDIAKKINTVIQTDIVGKVNSNAVNPFASVDWEDEFNYDMGANNERVIALVITGAHSGAGYHVTHHNYNYDSRTGKPIDLNQLLGSEGQARLRKAYYKIWKESIKENLKDPYFADDYKTCLAEAENTMEVTINRMLITEGGIRVWGGACLDGSSEQSDRTAEPHEFSFGQLLPMLTNYGYSCYVNKVATGPLQILLRGLIDGKYPISFTLLPGQASGSVGGLIVYDKVGTPLNLKGIMNGNQIVFHELDAASGQPISDIETTWDGTKLSGTFTNLKTKKQLPFLASPVK